MSLVLGSAVALAACGQPAVVPVQDAPQADPGLVATSPRPQPKPSPTADKPLHLVPVISSQDLAVRYDRLQAKLLSEGLLREDPGGLQDLSARDLATNFIRIALYDEYTPVEGRLVAQESRSRLRRWDGPVRVALDWGASVPESQRQADRDEVRDLVGNLAAASRHDVAMAGGPGNFTVFVVDEEARLALVPRLRAMIPGVTDGVLQSMLDIPPNTFCLAVAFSAPEAPQTYVRAVAIVRAEHPPLLRRACFHEEIAQGLGLANDSHAARPSIFNDDEEFALLTDQDRLMLRMLYDSRLWAGMDLQEAEPVVQAIAAELLPPATAAAAPTELASLQ